MITRPYRSVLYIPASNARAMEKARTLSADAIIFDLEDAVTPAEKLPARDLLARALLGFWPDLWPSRRGGAAFASFLKQGGLEGWRLRRRSHPGDQAGATRRRRPARDFSSPGSSRSSRSQS